LKARALVEPLFLQNELFDFLIVKELRGKPFVFSKCIKLIEQKARELGMKKVVMRIEAKNPNWKKLGKKFFSKKQYDYSTMTFEGMKYYLENLGRKGIRAVFKRKKRRQPKRLLVSKKLK